MWMAVSLAANMLRTILAVSGLMTKCVCVRSQSLPGHLSRPAENNGVNPLEISDKKGD